MPRVIVNLALTFDDRHVVEVAKALQERLPPDQWLLVRQLAAEVTAFGESAAAGCRMVVVPAAEMGAALSALKVARAE